MLKPATQEDIARRIGVTRITVSKAMRNHPDISAEMKSRVNRAAEELGYSPNQIARQLTSRTTHTIGVIVPDLENSFFSHIVDSMIDAASAAGYQVLLTVSREQADLESRNLRNLAGHRVDGLLVCLSQNTADPDAFHFVRQMGIPMVFFDRTLPGAGNSNVIFDDDQGVRLAIDQLVLAGFTRIAHLSGYPSASVGKERLAAYRAALEKHGLIVWKEWVIEGGYEIGDGYRSFQELYRRGNLPEVILTVNDRVALGVYRACAELGLRIPEDIGVVGFGFTETTQGWSPPLSVIAQDPRQMGRLAFERLLVEIQAENPLPPAEIRIPEEFVWNASVKFKR